MKAKEKSIELFKEYFPRYKQLNNEKAHEIMKEWAIKDLYKELLNTRIDELRKTIHDKEVELEFNEIRKILNELEQ